ncbi:MAG: cytochrome P450 [Egibacteraceae bacterium]
MKVVEDLPRLPFEQPDLLDIAPMLRTLQAERPVTRVRTPAGDVAWLVTGYEDVKALLADVRLGRSHPDPERAPRISNAAFLGGPMGDYQTEQADHARMRRLLAPAFSGRRMNALRTHVQDLVEGRLDRLASMTPPADLHEELSFPLPVLVICELLGVPYEDREQFRVWSDGIADMQDRARSMAALGDLLAYMHQLLQRKRRAPGEDVISDLIAAAHEDDGLTDSNVAELAAGLLFAGHETTVARIDYGTVLLVAYPEQREALQDDPSLASRAVEEILRFAAVDGSGGLPRYAHADISIRDVTIEQGDAVLLALSAANRDPAAFADPDRFDLTRHPNPHLALGHGSRFCLGASLARIELQTVFGTLFHRLPTLRLAVPAERLRVRGERITGGLTELPVTW